MIGWSEHEANDIKKRSRWVASIKIDLEGKNMYHVESGHVLEYAARILAALMRS